MWLRHLCLSLSRRRISLLRLRPAYPDLFYFSICGFKNFKTKAFIFNHLTGLRNAPGDGADQAADGGGIALVKAHVKKILQAADVNRALHDISQIAFTNDVMRKLMFVANFTHDFFHQVFQRDQPRDGAIFVNHDGHVDVVFLHFTQKMRSHFSFWDEQHRTHQFGDGGGAGLGFRKLDKIMRQHHAINLIDAGGEDRYAGMRFVAQHGSKLFNGGGGWNGKDVGARRHHVTHGLVAKFNHGLNELAVTLFQNALFFRGFNEGVHGFRRMLRLFWLMRLSQRGHGEAETKHDGDGQHEIDQDLQERNEFNQPHAARPREQHVRQQPVANNNDQNDADDGLNSFRPGPMRVSKDKMADDEGNRGRAELREDRKR